MKRPGKLCRVRERLDLKLSLWFLLGALVPTLLLSVFMYSGIHNSMREKELLHIQDKINLLDSALDNTVSDIEDSMTAVLSFERVKDILTQEAGLVTREGFSGWKQIEEILQTQFPYPENGYYFTLIGKNDIVYTNGSMVNWTETFRGPLAERIKSYSNGILLFSRSLYQAGQKRNDTITFGKRILQGGEVIGVILVDIDVDVFDQIFASFDEATNLVYIVNPEGQIVYSNIDWQEHELPRFEQISGGDTAWLEGREYLYARDFSESTNCTTYILIPTDYIYHDSILMLNESALVLCLVLVLTVLFAVLVSRWVSGPILRLAEQVRGYTRDHAPIAMEYRRQDEVGRLAGDVREMSLRIGAMVQQVYDTERAKRKLQFQALQAQINPHMIYNTLNTITSLAQMQNIANIEEVSSSFTHLLHIVLKTEGDFLTLGQELDYLSCYMSIKKYNLFQEMELRLRVPPELYQEPVLKLLLQPFVENSIKHGFVNPAKRGVIQIRAERQGEDIAVSITDNGVGMSREQISAITAPAAPSSSGSSIGIRNTLQRLSLQYEGRYQFYILSSPGHYTQINLIYPREGGNGSAPHPHSR